MTSGTYTYDGDDVQFDLEWLRTGDLSSHSRKRHERLLEAAANEVAPYVKDALAIGDHIRLEEVKLRLDDWATPKVTVWLRAPPGYLEEDDDDPDAAEKVRQRKEFYRDHNAVHDERMLVNSDFYDIQIDVRQF